ncbi:MAG: hypothetical protein P4L41_02080 [Flavipsychrobacter sp.]|nr:hypothetical protein [Flavipsychrobacter sp.]
MLEGFELPVVYKGQEMEFGARLVISGYVYQFIIIVNDRDLVFEKDDEGNYRVINYTPAISVHVDTALLEAIIVSLKEISS